MSEMPSDLVALIDQHGAQLDRADFERLHKPAHDRSVRLLGAIAASARSAGYGCSSFDVMLDYAEGMCGWYECAECHEWSSIDAVRCAHNDEEPFGARTIDRYLPFRASDARDTRERLTYRRDSFDGPHIIPALHPHPLERGRMWLETTCDVCDREIGSSEVRDTLCCHVCHVYDICRECADRATGSDVANVGPGGVGQGGEP